jgi:glycosyltransferase involved in cell wall biosynthesis
MGGPWIRLLQWIEREFALPNFDLVYTVSQAMKQKVLAGRTREERTRVIHTGLDVKRFDLGRERETVRAELGLPKDALVFGAVSRLSPEKGHGVLLEAFRCLAPSHPRFHLLIVGEGPERGALEARAKELGLDDRVAFAGYYGDLPGALRAMDVFVQATVLEEGFPTSVLEAQASGLPVVASDSGGTRETMEPGVTGLLVEQNDPRALAGAMHALGDDEPRRRAMGSAARERIAGSFSLEEMIAQMGAFYYAALRQRRQSAHPS